MQSSTDFPLLTPSSLFYNWSHQIWADFLYASKCSEPVFQLGHLQNSLRFSHSEKIHQQNLCDGSRVRVYAGYGSLLCIYHDSTYRHEGCNFCALGACSHPLFTHSANPWRIKEVSDKKFAWRQKWKTELVHSKHFVVISLTCILFSKRSCSFAIIENIIVLVTLQSITGLRKNGQRHPHFQSTDHGQNTSEESTATSKETPKHKSTNHHYIIGGLKSDNATLSSSPALHLK